MGEEEKEKNVSLVDMLINTINMQFRCVINCSGAIFSDTFKNSTVILVKRCYVQNTSFGRQLND